MIIRCTGAFSNSLCELGSEFRRLEKAKTIPRSVHIGDKDVEESLLRRLRECESDEAEEIGTANGDDISDNDKQNFPEEQSALDFENYSDTESDVNEE
ncbi:hypothetical protein QE152_g12792 [Popillia japonica]|uniref:Uncharacterized protein n=1 Tax=Popillia japonica TaxID=7064 RepID=A0AAW1LQV0_POPJA